MKMKDEDEAAAAGIRNLGGRANNERVQSVCEVMDDIKRTALVLLIAAGMVTVVAARHWWQRRRG
jgi:hypothetical protein